MSDDKPNKPLGKKLYIRNAGTSASERSPSPLGSHLYIRQPSEATQQLYIRQPEPAPAPIEDTQPDISRQDDDDMGEPIQSGLDEYAQFLSQQATSYVREEQHEAPLQQAILEPDRYQPPQGQSRLGREVQIDKFGGQLVTDKYIDLPQASRRQGLYIIGIQGTGKSGLIENLIIQDINQDRGVALLDPHGDLTQAVLSRLPAAREQDVIYLDIADEDYPFGLNLFTCSNPNSAKAVQIVVDKVRHIFEKLLGVSHDTPLLLEYLTNCTRTLIANPGSTMADIPLLLQDRAWRRRLVANVTDSDVQRFWQHHEQKKPADQIYEISSTLRRVGEFLLPLSRPIVGQSTTIDLQRIMDEGKILLVKLSAQLPSVSSLIGAMFVALFLNAAYARPANKRRQFNLYADEFQRFATEDFATLLEEARKFGIATTIAHQNRGQLDSKNEPLDANLKDRTRSVANLVVFKVNSIDANGLAGEFDIVPQEAWEQEIKQEWFEPKIDMIEDEAKEDIEEISQNPVDYLGGARGAHKNPTVTRAFNTIYALLFNRAANSHVQKRNELLLNSLLVDVMEKRVVIGTDVFVQRVEEIVRAVVWWQKLDSPYTDELSKKYDQLASTVIPAAVVSSKTFTKLAQDFINAKTVADTESHLKYWGISGGYYDRIRREYVPVDTSWTPNQEEIEKERKRYTEKARLQAIENINQLVPFIADLIALCKGLTADPIMVPTGQKRLVPKKRTNLTYLTHPRKTIMHPQRTYADVLNEVASQLTSLDDYLARVRFKNAEGKRVEYTIRTLRPEAGLQGKALQERLDSIKQQNIANGYLRERAAVEAEIKLRQEQLSAPPEDDAPPDEQPVSRRPRN